jgi:hypothetical protein
MRSSNSPESPGNHEPKTWESNIPKKSNGAGAAEAEGRAKGRQTRPAAGANPPAPATAPGASKESTSAAATSAEIKQVRSFAMSHQDKAVRTPRPSDRRNKQGPPKPPPRKPPPIKK